VLLANLGMLSTLSSIALGVTVGGRQMWPCCIGMSALCSVDAPEFSGCFSAEDGRRNGKPSRFDIVLGAPTREVLTEGIEVSLYIMTERASVEFITVHFWPLSVTESFGLPPQREGVMMSDIQKFDLHEWLVPPILVPLLLGLLVAGAVIIRW
jgi:hypothetical protein